MLLRSEVKFCLSKHQHIFQALPAYNSTYIILYCWCPCPINDLSPMYKPEQSIQHRTQEGNILHTYPCDPYTQGLIMIKEDLLLVPRIKQNCISIINLRTRSEKMIYFEFRYDEHYRQLFFFTQSNLLCVKQNTIWKGTSDFSLRYVDLSVGETILEFTSKQLKDNYTYVPKAIKGNNHSLVLLFQKIGYGNGLLMHELVMKQGKLCTNLRHIDISLMKRQIEQPLFYYNLWQLNQNQLLMVKNQVKQGQFIQILNIKQNSIDRVVQTHWPGSKLKGTISSVILGDYVYAEPIEDYIEFEIKHIYFQLHHINFRQATVVISGLQQRQYLEKYRYICNCHYDPNMLVKKRCSRDQYSAVTKLISEKLVIIKQMYMYFLLAINDDFDDDLLFDAIGILAEI